MAWNGLQSPRVGLQSDTLAIQRAHKVGTGNFRRFTAKTYSKPRTNDFKSDTGRKSFGFSHEELDGSLAYYEGEFKYRLRSGHGTLHSDATGDTYVGEFHLDRFHGKGKQESADGWVYTGEWRQGQKHGQGELVAPGGARYVGQFEANKKHGKGVQHYVNGDRYDGNWFKGMCSGHGTYYFEDGARYEGVWSSGRYDGPGVLVSSDGTSERQWHRGGRLMKREVVVRDDAGRVQVGLNLAVSRKIEASAGQTREEVQQHVTLAKPLRSKHTLPRDTLGLDLSAPPLLPACLPSPPASERGEDGPMPLPGMTDGTVP